MDNNTQEKIKILMVDDDPFQRMVMKSAVLEDDYTIIEAENGAEAVDLFIKHFPDLVILDVEMPIMNGYETCQKIRSLPEGRFAGILMATGLDDNVSINEAYRCGATDFIAKPINWAIIRKRIKYILRSVGNLKSLQDLQSRNQAIIQSLPDALIYFDQEGRYIESLFNKIDWLGYPDKIKALFLDKMLKVKQTKKSLSFEFELTDNSLATEHKEARIVFGADDCFVVLLRDITEKILSEKKLWTLAYHDALTNLPNRAFLTRTLDEHISESKISTPFSLFLINVNRFKVFNDAYGNKFGDTLLKEISGKIKSYLEKASFEKSFLARLSGAEFALICFSEKVEFEITLAQGLMNMLSVPIILDQFEVYLTSSIGISLFPKDSRDAESLLKFSSAALSVAKKEGKNKYCFFESHINTDAIPNIDFENKLRKAFVNDEFVLYYQPQFCFKTGELIGAEALARWVHPELGVVSPIAFIPILEELGLINQLGERVLRIGLRALKNWTDLDLGVNLESLSINLASSQFNDPGFSSMILALLDEFRVDPSKINIEITESMFVNQSELTLKNLHFLDSLNMLISIDDFGVGYSSLSYLTAFPVDHLKIDCEFITNIHRSQSDQNLVKAIIQMAHALELKVVAEGIETEEHVALLKKLNCDYAQGYYYSKPLPEAAFIKLLETQAQKNLLKISGEKGEKGETRSPPLLNL